MINARHFAGRSDRHSPLLRGGLGAGALAGVMATAAVASAAPQHAPAPAPARTATHAAAAHATARPDSTIAVSPGTVDPGAKVTVTGDAPTSARAGRWITLMSDAFSSRRMLNGIPAVRTQVLANGTYS